MGNSDGAGASPFSPERAAQVHEAIARLSRRFRALELPGELTQERLSTLAAITTNEPISLSALAEVEMVSLATMSRMISALDAVGLVRRREDGEDGRAVLISTTTKGRQLYQRSVQQSLRQIITTINSLDSEQIAAVQALFSSLDRS